MYPVLNDGDVDGDGDVDVNVDVDVVVDVDVNVDVDVQEVVDQGGLQFIHDILLNHTHQEDLGKQKYIASILNITA